LLKIRVFSFVINYYFYLFKIEEQKYTLFQEYIAISKIFFIFLLDFF